MKSHSLYHAFPVLMMLAALALSGCGREEIAADLDPPAAPHFVPRSADTALVEQGVDAVPEGDWIHLVWEPGPEPDLEGYRLYRRAVDDTADIEMHLIADLPLAELPDLNQPGYLDNDPALAPHSQTGITGGFRYFIGAYDEAGNESGLTDSIYYRLLPKPSLTQPVQQDSALVLSWSYSLAAAFQVDYFVVRLFRAEGGGWTPFWTLKYNLFNPLQVIYPEIPDPGQYLFQVDVVGAGSSAEPAGSEAALEFMVL
ncbi:MAG: hypothetical protein C4524_01795 [Candidatus Zixiibacteriota bacterium]|nr:MAG: hypothetical protein C4524_01795 [candidate division Zixibacteria bacterium]